jgi:hypothetical protein
MTNPSHIFRTLMLVAAFSLVVAPRGAPAQTTGHEQHQPPAQAPHQMKMGHMSMPAMNMDEMAAKKKANTERIAILMAQVKTATGDAKVAAMAEVIAIMADERIAMQEHCAAMHAAMHK